MKRVCFEILLLLNIFVFCFSLEIKPGNESFKESITKSEEIFDEIKLSSNRYLKHKNLNLPTSSNDANNDDNGEEEEGSGEDETESSTSDAPQEFTPSPGTDAPNNGNDNNNNGNNNGNGNKPNTNEFIGYNVDITHRCVYNENCTYPYTCQYTVMGRRCIKDLSIEFPQRNYTGIPTIEQLESIVNQTYDLVLPWNDEDF